MRELKGMLWFVDEEGRNRCAESYQAFCRYARAHRAHTFEPRGFHYTPVEWLESVAPGIYRLKKGR